MAGAPWKGCKLSYRRLEMDESLGKLDATPWWSKFVLVSTNFIRRTYGPTELITVKRIDRSTSCGIAQVLDTVTLSKG